LEDVSASRVCYSGGYCCCGGEYPRQREEARMLFFEVKKEKMKWLPKLKDIA